MSGVYIWTWELLLFIQVHSLLYPHTSSGDVWYDQRFALYNHA